MVLTANQLTTFFEDTGQMGLITRTRANSLKEEGITSIDDLVELDDDDWDQGESKCKRPDKTKDPHDATKMTS